MNPRTMRILGIETSCDETATAIFAGNPAAEQGRILAERIASQIPIHARFGGIVPEVASRQHLAVLPGLVEETLQQAGLHWHDLDGIAVTAGPGLMGALLVGTSFARAIGRAAGLPVFPIHHMEGHLLAPGIDAALPPFPFISLLVSGGHTMLVRVDGIGRYTVVGQTIDDAAGECFDKSARLLGLPYPGGPEIARLAADGDARRFPLPRPMLQHDNLNFSFSGLKTAVMLATKSSANEPGERWKHDLAAAVEAAIVEVLVTKSVRACRLHGIPDLVIAGGVAANQQLRTRLHAEADECGLTVHLPDPRYCTDNGAMIAYAGYCRARTGLPPAEWDARARWPLEQIDTG
jgi:tRNA N6-adenosine threonylcarbamoyltransferase